MNSLLRPSKTRNPKIKPVWANRKTIIIVNQDMAFGLQLTKSLCPVGHHILGPVTTLDGAYRLIVNEKPTIAVLDATMPAVETSRLSDMLCLLDVPHLVVDTQTNSLKRLSLVEGQTVETHISVSRPFAEEVSDAIWDIHSRSLIFDLLDGPDVDVRV